MMRSAPLTRGLGRGLIQLGMFCAAAALLPAKVKWEAISKADLESRQCPGYPGVAAEELFKYQVLDADREGAWNEYYVRRKVYNAKAAQESGLLNIEYEASHELRGLAARVLKVGGKVIELGPKDFTDAVAAKTKGIKIKSKAIAVPDLEAGDVVEYQWIEPTDASAYQPQTWFVQSLYPTRLFRFTLRNTQSDCTVRWFNVANAKSSVVDGNKILTVTDVPPYESESLMPPERDLRGTIVIIYTGRWARWWGKEDLWRSLSSEWGENYRLKVRPDGAVKKLAREIIGDATTADEKLARLYNYARTTISNLDYYDDAELQKARKRLVSAEGNQSVAETIERKSGWPSHVDELFASLCSAAGFEVRINWSSSREHTTLVKHSEGFVFLDYDLVAVKVGEAWRHFRPGDHFVPPGMIDWRFEAAPGLLCEEDAKDAVFATSPPAPADASEELHRAAFALNADGDCEGTVTFAYTGHCAVAKKHEWIGLTKEEIRKAVEADITSRLPTAELGEFAFENTGGIGEPVKVSFKMKVPAYAEAAGDRLIFAPAVFQKGASPVFKSSTRKWPIAFPYAWHARDEVTINLPADYELDAPSSPQGLGAADAPFRARYKIALRKKDNQLAYSRDVVVVDGGQLTLAAESYPSVKKIFDLEARSDAHTLVIKPKEPAPAAAAPAAATPDTTKP